MSTRAHANRLDRWRVENNYLEEFCRSINCSFRSVETTWHTSRKLFHFESSRINTTNLLFENQNLKWTTEIFSFIIKNYEETNTAFLKTNKNLVLIAMCHYSFRNHIMDKKNLLSTLSFK